ncbi:response regulator transcription factor [Vibrio quintilis]|uniref:DNA-binding transcriptional regulator RstA n=2 Tax=Vibrio quintilis TaxID=1117707 RepID=A0A1M7YYN3_9VIBR|nr:response regulator transcription factor [Vibrio quintilis]SHO57748.1 DNA-binding transcriptional regulator RstA [Vibrio quintilis]
MLAEDDIELARLMKEYFTHHFTISLIQNGIDAVPAILEQQPDLVILDVMLPDKMALMSASKFASNIRNTAKTNKTVTVCVPVIYFSN